MAITFTFCHMDSCLEAARFTHLQQVKKQLVLFLFGSFLIISCQKGSSFISNFKQIGHKKISVITRRLKRPRRQGSQEERKTQKSEHPTSPIRTWLYEVKMPKIKLQVGNKWGHHRLKRPNNHSWGCHNHWAGCLQHEFIHLFWHCNVKKTTMHVLDLLHCAIG